MPQYLSTDPNAGQPAVTPPAASQPRYLSTDPHAGEPARAIRSDTLMGHAGDFLSESTSSINPVKLYHALKSVVMDLPGTVQGIGRAQGELKEKAEQSFQAGDYVAASRHLVNYLLPFIGPRLDQSGDAFAEGRYGKGLGILTDLGVQTALMKVPAKVSVPVRPRLLRPSPNPQTQAAVRFAEQEGIPVRASTVTGSPMVANLEKRLEGTVGGSAPMQAAREAEQTALAATGARLARETNRLPPPARIANRGAPQTPVSAGERVRAAVEAKIRDLHQTATTQYGIVRAAEQQQAQTIRQSGGVRAPATAAQPFTAVPLAVDLANTKAALRPLYDRMMREATIAPPMGGKAQALGALDRLMRGPDQAPLSLVDEALGDLKAMARGADMPELRTGGQSRAALAVQALDARVRATAAQAGPDVLRALEAGRAATTRKYLVAETRDLLSAEPGQVYRQLTANADTAVARLRAVQSVAPVEIPNVARAYLDDALDLATSEGGFIHTDRLFANWQKLGGDTKRVLFPRAGQIEALDNFFLLAKKLGTNANPSGTANVLRAFNPTEILGYLPAKALAKVLTSPRAVKYLTTGLRLSASPAPAAKALAAAQVMRAAQSAGIPLPLRADQSAPPAAPERRQP